MPDGVDDTIFSVSALDNFSDTLDELEEDLMQIEAAVQVVDPVDIDAAIADAAADIAQLHTAIKSLPNEKEIDIETDSDIPWNVASEEERFNLMGMQTGKGMWQVNPFAETSQPSHLLNERGEPNRLRGLDSPQIQRLDIFGQADIFDGPLGSDERRGGLGRSVRPLRGAFGGLHARRPRGDGRHLRGSADRPNRVRAGDGVRSDVRARPRHGAHCRTRLRGRVRERPSVVAGAKPEHRVPGTRTVDGSRCGRRCGGVRGAPAGERCRPPGLVARYRCRRGLADLASG